MDFGLLSPWIYKDVQVEGDGEYISLNKTRGYMRIILHYFKFQFCKNFGEIFMLDQNNILQMMDKKLWMSNTKRIMWINCELWWLFKAIQGYKQDVINIINIPSLVALANPLTMLVTLGNKFVLNTIQ